MVPEILLVEDNMADAEMTVRALKKVKLAHQVLHLQDGEEALNYIFKRGPYANREEGHPKVIMLDIKMPKVDGIEVLRQLKANDETRRIPIIIMTSSAEEQDIFTSYDLGVNSYVVKPVDFQSFATAVSQLGLYWLITNQSPV